MSAATGLWSAKRGVAGLIVASFLATPGAAAQPAGELPPVEAPAPEEAAKLEEAKRLFRQGNELRKVGDFQRALDFYQRSRALVPSMPNTLNAAFCLQQLGRFDEALELYELLLTEQAGKLGEEDKVAVATATQTLRPKVGTVEVSANVTAQLVIDGRMRGELPTSAVRVLPGERTIRVMKDGYETFEQRVIVKAGELVRVDARLARLTSAGRLRVDDAQLVGADLYVDGALVGQLPWEGTLAPGPHLFFVRKDDVGTAPALATVVDGQTVLASTRAMPLSREIRVVVTPPQAQFALNGVPLGRGTWQGRLPVGPHTIEAREEGYRPGRIVPIVTESTAGDLVLELAIDRSHPRWASPESNSIFVEAFGGYALASSLGSGAEADCAAGRCGSDEGASGVLAGARGGYELTAGLAVELGAGYLVLSKALTRTRDSVFGSDPIVPVSYAFADDLRLSGPFVSLGLAYRHTFGDTIGIDGRFHVGGMLANARDPISATAMASGETADVTVGESGKPVGSPALFVMPSAQLRVQFGSFHIAAGAVVSFFLLEGARNEHGETSVVKQGRCGNGTPMSPGRPESVDCAQGTDLVREERAFGQFIAIAPTLAAGWTF